MSNLSQVGSRALTSIGQLGAGLTMSPEDGDLVLARANLLLAMWGTQRLLLPAITSRTYNLSVNTQDYTVGPVGATFTGTRPTFIESAQINIPGSSVWLPLNIIDKAEWDAIRNKGARADIPDSIYVEYSYPNIGFHVNPAPTGTPSIALGAWEPLTQFTDLFAALSFQPGFEEFLEASLAIALCPDYDQPVTPALQGRRQEAMEAYMKINAQALGGALSDAQKMQSPNVGQPIPSGGQG